MGTDTRYVICENLAFFRFWRTHVPLLSLNFMKMRPFDGNKGSGVLKTSKIAQKQKIAERESTQSQQTVQQNKQKKCQTHKLCLALF